MPGASSTAARVPGSGIREIVNLVVERGGDILRLEIGEPDFRTPAHVIEAAHRAAQAGARYTQSAGTLALREAISAKLERVNQLRCPPERVIVCQGAVQGCSAVLSAVLEPGDEVLIADPAWPNYEMLTLLHGAVPVRYPAPPERGFLPDVSQIEALLGPRVPPISRRVCYLAPVGSVRAHDELIFEGSRANAASLDPERVVGLYSFSKTYAMTGWRIGYVAAPAWLAPVLWTLQEPLVSCVSEISQAAAVAALQGPQDCVAEMREAYRDRRDLVVRLHRGGGHRGGATARRLLPDAAVRAGRGRSPRRARSGRARRFRGPRLCVRRCRPQPRPHLAGLQPRGAARGGRAAGGLVPRDGRRREPGGRRCRLTLQP
jgi:aspartate aminotransferase